MQKRGRGSGSTEFNQFRLSIEHGRRIEACAIESVVKDFLDCVRPRKVLLYDTSNLYISRSQVIKHEDEILGQDLHRSWRTMRQVKP